MRRRAFYRNPRQIAASFAYSLGPPEVPEGEAAPPVLSEPLVLPPEPLALPCTPLLFACPLLPDDSSSDPAVPAPLLPEAMPLRLRSVSFTIC